MGAWQQKPITFPARKVETGFRVKPEKEKREQDWQQDPATFPKCFLLPFASRLEIAPRIV
jgi:hypothetical protein